MARSIRLAINARGEQDFLSESLPPPDRLNETHKKSLRVFNRKTYLSVKSEFIAMLHVGMKSTLLVTFDGQEYAVNHPLEQIQNLLPLHQFFRLNRQYTIHINAVKEVQHFNARKLLIIPTIPFAQKLIVGRQKRKSFLDWLANRK